MSYRSRLAAGQVRGDPYETKAKFKSKCPDCGKAINPGDPITVWPKSTKGSKARHESCSADDYSNFLACAADEAMGGY